MILDVFTNTRRKMAYRPAFHERFKVDSDSKIRTSQLNAPARLECLPAAQGVQLFKTVDAEVARYFPPGQLVHDVDPSTPWNFPPGQLVHVVDAVDPVAVP
jgi:hypothetical protein